MAGSPSAKSGEGSEGRSTLLERLLARVPFEVTVTRAVVAVTILAIVLRVVLLGARTAHWDEARVAYWTNYYAETGTFAYRHIIHGPFVQHAAASLIRIVGASDFVVRLPVAMVGGLLPLSALWFREHLRDDETVVLGLLLGVSAPLLYYSRFMRSDMLVGAFMFAAFAALVRFHDTRRWRYLYAGGAFVALGFASKENALVYVLTWIGGVALLLDHALFRPQGHASGLDYLRSTRLGRVPPWFGRLLRAPERLAAKEPPDPRDRLRDPDSTVRRAGRYLGHPVGVVALFLAITVFLYAPRGAGEVGYRVAQAGGGDVVGFWEGVGNPSELAGMVTGTFDHATEEFLRWTSTGGGAVGGERDLVGYYGQQVADDNREIVFFMEAKLFDWLGAFVRVLYETAPVVLGFGVLGFLYERFVADTSRNLVMFASYGGLISILGYPMGMDVYAPWVAVHVVLPLAIPAAVLLTVVYRRGASARVSGDTLSAAIAVFVLLLATGGVGYAVAENVYLDDTSRDNRLVQYAQPADDLGPATETFRRLGTAHTGSPDVLVYYGGGNNGTTYNDREAFVKENESTWPPSNSSMDFRPHCTPWGNTLPLNWYFAASDVDVACEREPTGLLDQVDAGVPMIIAPAADATLPTSQLEAAGYDRIERRMRAWGYETVFWIHEDWRPGGA
ncbi:MAG: flippase activity-associated protein Agl23 [Haloarculaceae archaeon]